MSFDYDLFIIGAGSAGLAAAKQAANYGVRVAIAEQANVGGACINYGCIPEKLIAYAASFSSLYQNAVAYGWGECNSSFNWSKFMLAKDQKVHSLNQLHIESIKKLGVELFGNHASFLDAHTLEVEGRKITANKILIAVGAKNVKSDIPGIEYAITTNELFHLKRQPKHIAIIGGNYIAIKTAGSLNELGSKVTIVNQEEEILSNFDQDICISIKEGMTQEGIEIISSTIVEKIVSIGDAFNLTFSGSTSDTLTVDTILNITFRVPNLSNLSLEKAGIDVTQQGAIMVDEYSRTTQANIFAVGDCIDRIQLTPVAIAEAHAFVDTEFGNKPHTVNYNLVPISVSYQPEAATVGLTESQAREKFGESVQCYREEFKPLFYSLTGKDKKTLVKLVVDSNSDRVLGAHMVGEYASEIIQCIAVAIKMGATKKDFDTSVGIHPSIAEELFTL